MAKPVTPDTLIAAMNRTMAAVAEAGSAQSPAARLA